MCYEIYIRNDDVVEWSKPMFPKVNKDIDALRVDGSSLTHLYDHVAIFKDGDLIEALPKEGS